MKKIYTLLTMMLLTVAPTFAQTLEITVNGVTMENGKDYTLAYDGIMTVGTDGVFESYIYAMEPEIMVHSSVRQTVSVIAEDLDNIENKENVQGIAQICFGGSCEPIDKGHNYVVTKEAIMTAGTSMDTQFHVNFGSVLVYEGEFIGEKPTFPLERRIRFTVKSGNEQLSFVLIQTCDKDGVSNINSISTDNAVNATAEGISYNLSTTGTLDIYSANGAAVMHKTVEVNGTVSLSALPAGVYVYSLKAGGKSYTGKVAIK